MNPFCPEAFFDLNDEMSSKLFEGVDYVWEAIPYLPIFIEDQIVPALAGEIESGAWLDPGRVQLSPGSRVERGAIVRGPTIIGKDTVIRTGAYIRGHVIIGENCVVGHGTEIRQSLVRGHTNINHHSVVVTSLIGFDVQISGYASLANCLLSGREIKIEVDVDGKQHCFSTGRIHLGAVIGDGSKLGAKAFLPFPGTLIGKRCIVYPQCSVPQYLPDDTIVKQKSLEVKLISRKGRRNNEQP